MKNPTYPSLSKRSMLLLIVILATLLWLIDQVKPKPAPGQALLTDINNIRTLRTQFNLDAGKSRLIILVSPT